MASRRVVLARIAVTAVVVPLLVGALVVALVTRTDWGRERIRAFALDRMAGIVNGRVRIDRLDGSLLTGAVLEGVEIEDSAGNTFLRADTVSVGYTLSALVAGNTILRDVRLVRPVLLLDQTPDGTWSWTRIFPTDTMSAMADTAAAQTISTMRLEDVRVVDGTVVIRNAWVPPDSLAGEAREAAIRAALAPSSRVWVMPAAGGWQRVSIIRSLDAYLPVVRLSDPSEPARLIEVASARMIAFPFRPPAADVRALSGSFTFDGDSIRVEDATLELPSTRLHADARYVLGSGTLAADVVAKALAFDDLRWFRPDLPDGGGSGGLELALGSGHVRVAARELDLAIDGGRVAGRFDVRTGDTLHIGEADMRIAGVDTRSLARLVGAAPLPIDGVVSGSVRLAGTTDALDVEGGIELLERSGRVSRIVADGVVGSADDGGLRAEGLAIRLEPLQTSLVRQVRPQFVLTGTLRGHARVTGTTRSMLDVVAEVAHGPSRIRADGGIDLHGEPSATALRVYLDPLRVATLEAFSADLPVGGALTGTAVVDGSPKSGLRARLAISHADTTGTSRVEGTAVWRPGGGFDLDLRIPQLSLRTAGAFAPAAGLAGTASGTLRASGTPARFTFATDLAVPDSGRIAAEGVLATAAATPGYDVRANLLRVDASALTSRAPPTRLSGRVSLDGQGTDLARMDARIDADLFDARIAEAAVDTSSVRVALADGLAHVERAHLRLASATADFAGTLGLVDGRSGELRYDLEIGDLSDFSAWIPGDSGTVAARPITQARRVAAARADSARSAQATEVQRAATGLPASPTLDVDSVPPLARDSVAGRIVAGGTLRGSIGRLDMHGSAQAEGVVAAGATFADASATWSARALGTPDADLELEVGADSLSAAGFAFDSVATDVRYRGERDRGTGALEVRLFQDADRDFRIASEFLLELDRRELTFNELVMRFDTVRWSAPHAGRLTWRGAGVTIDSLALTSDAGTGRLVLDGRFATDAPSDLRIQATDMPIGQIAALLQDTTDATGLLSLGAELGGTPEAPVFEGTADLRDASFGGRDLPDLHSSFEYAATELRANAELTGDGRTLLSARARLPIDLALRGLEGPRLLERPLGIEAHADSLTLESLPALSESLADVRGRIRGDVVVGGTWDAPALNGGVTLDRASVRIAPAGVFLRDIAGAVELRGDAVSIDSLRAFSGGGPIRVAGRLDVERLTRPTFDLTIAAEDALVLDNDRGRLSTDASLTVEGPMDSVLVRGDVRIREGVVAIPDMGETRRVAPLDAASVRAVADSSELDAEILPTPNPLLDNLRLDMTLRVGRNTWVRSSDANVEVYTPADADPLRIRMNMDRPGFALDGVIHADRGEYEFAGRVFDLTTGAVTFLPGSALDPLIQLSANYEVARRGQEALVVQIHLTGSLSQPRIALESTSQPPLSESDLLSYLAFGRATSSVLALDDASLAGGSDGLRGIGALAQQQIASLALGTAVNDAVSNIERRAGRALDVFRIHPAQLPAELAFANAFDNFLRGTEIEAGKYVTSGLFVAADGRVTTETYPGLRLEYETPTGFSWRAIWEARYLPREPTLVSDETARTTRVLGTFFYWSRRF